MYFLAFVALSYLVSSYISGDIGMSKTRSNIRVIRITCNVSFSVFTFSNDM